MADIYEATPLNGENAIRVLTIESGILNDEVVCQLCQRRGDQGYEALSWNWANEEWHSPIKIKSGSKIYSFHVGQNLEAALRRLRRTGAPRTIWIDAICMNQKDKAEKSSQVPMMADIYRNATNVCIWLGEASADSKLAMNFIKTRISNLGDFDRLVNDERTPHEWSALVELMRRPWFGRRWVIQEVALASKATLHCGDDEVSWSEFAIAVALFKEGEDKISQLLKRSREFDHHPDPLGDIQALGASLLVDVTSNLFRKSDDGNVLEGLLTLESLISDLTTFRASNPRDIIYAVLALAKDTRAQPPIKARHGLLRLSGDSASSVSAISRPPSLLRLHDEVLKSPNEANNQTETLFSKKLMYSVAHSTDGASVVPPAAEATTASVCSHSSDSFEDARETVEPLAASVETIAEQSEAAPIEVVVRAPTTPTAPATSSEAIISTNVLNILRERKDDSKAKNFQVDYEKTSFQACQDFLQFIIGKSKSLDIICHPWAPEEEKKDLPSWIPNLSDAAFGVRQDNVAGKRVWKMSRKNADPLVGRSSFGERIYSASGLRGADWRFSEQPHLDRSLFVKGFVLDTVREKTDDSAVTGSIPSQWLEFVGWHDRSSPPPELFWRALVADRGPNGRNKPAYYPKACQYVVSQSVDGDAINTQGLITDGVCSIARQFLLRVQAVIWNRRLIKARRKFLGLAPRSVDKDDMICILFGCSVPVILRALMDTNGKVLYHKFIGPCYTHGMMDGEAIAYRQRTKGMAELEFELR